MINFQCCAFSLNGETNDKTAARRNVHALQSITNSPEEPVGTTKDNILMSRRLNGAH